MRLLHVGNDPRDAELRRQLQASAPRFRLDTAATRHEATARLGDAETSLYDLVLTNARLADGDGLSLLTEIRARSLPLAVMVIVNEGDEKTAAALQAGADDYLVRRNGYLESLPVMLENALDLFRAETARRARQLTVLYAEPNAADAARTHRHLLRYASHIRLDVVSTGFQVLERLAHPAAPNYDVILLDHRTPGMDALEVLKELRRRRSLDTPVVLVTRQGNEEAALQAVKLGATSYVVRNPGYLYELPVSLENAFYRAELTRKQIALAESEARFRAVLDNLPVGVLIQDPQAEITFCNAAAATLLGIPEEQLMGKTSLDSEWDVIHEDYSPYPGSTHPVVQAIAKGEPVLHATMGVYRRETRDRVWLLVNAAPRCSPAGNVQEVVCTFSDISARRRAEAALRESETALRKSQEELRRLAGKLLSAQEEERGRLARELHDDLSQRIAALGIETGALQHLVRGPEPVVQKLQQIQDQISHLAADVHATSRQLHPSILDDLGLPVAIQSECSNFERREGIPVRYEHRDVPEKLPQETALCLYRVVQESLRNIGKHSGAQNGQVLLRGVDRGISVDVSDSGAGFDPSAIREGHGLGLASMEERMRLIRGTFSIESAPGRGTKVRAWAPLAARDPIGS